MVVKIAGKITMGGKLSQSGSTTFCAVDICKNGQPAMTLSLAKKKPMRTANTRLKGNANSGVSVLLLLDGNLHGTAYVGDPTKFCSNKR